MTTRAQKRAQQKQVRRHDDFLNELLHRFYHFLDKEPKPTTEEVRSEFVKSEMTWKLYCQQYGLGIKTSLLFNARVSYEWERKYVNKRTSR